MESATKRSNLFEEILAKEFSYEIMAPRGGDSIATGGACSLKLLPQSLPSSTYLKHTALPSPSFLQQKQNTSRGT